MAICIVVLSAKENADQLAQKLEKASIPLVKCDLIKPKCTEKSSITERSAVEQEQMPNSLNPVDFETIELLNPKLSRNSRQKKMASLLMPFGFIAGLTFTKMTGLTTFSDLGVGYLGESLSGGLIGMASGLMGSYVASSSVNSTNNEDIAAIKKLSEKGLWLLLIQTPLGIDMPWSMLRGENNSEIFRLLDQ